jgi:cobalt-zinc-cadmium efflux system membrane fusion protein
MKLGSLETLGLCLMLGFLAAGCGDREKDKNAGAPPPLKVEQANDPDVFQVDHPDQFPLVTAVEHFDAPQLKATGTVTPDISRNVPVISVAAGRVVEIAARLGDTVKKGQLLLRVQSAEVAAAYSDYQKAVADEQLTRTQLERAQLLYDKGAFSLND